MSEDEIADNEFISDADQDWWCHLFDTMKYILIHDLPTQEEEICIREFYDENDFYSTNIFAVHHIAKRILSIKDLDKRLKAGDIKLVCELGNIKIGDNKRYFYSFSTKYCSHHNPNVFPIYDNYVERVLLYFNKVDKFSSFKRKDLKNYRKFKEILLDF